MLSKQPLKLYQQGRGDEFPWGDYPDGIPYYGIFVWEPNESISLPNSKPLLCQITGWASGYNADADGQFVKECTDVRWAEKKEPEYVLLKGSNVKYHLSPCAIVTSNQGGG